MLDQIIQTDALQDFLTTIGWSVGIGMVLLGILVVLDRKKASSVIATNKSYNSKLELDILRQEILERIKMRHQIIIFTAAVASAIIGWSITEKNMQSLALVYPVLASLLILSWAQNNWRIKIIAAYIRNSIEKHEIKEGQTGWETHNSLHRDDWSLTVVSHLGLFLLSQILAFIIGIRDYHHTYLYTILVPLNVCSIFLTLFYISKSKH